MPEPKVQFIRAFIAVRVAVTPALAEILQTLASLGKAVRPVVASTLHATLRFLGPIDPADAPALSSAIQTAIADTPAFEAPLVGLGAFPTLRRPSVIWAGLQEGGRLAVVVDRLHPALAALGFAGSKQPWLPHLTLARIKARPPAALFDLLEHHRATALGIARIDSIELMRSDLLPTGARHTVLSSHRFSG